MDGIHQKIDIECFACGTPFRVYLNAIVWGNTKTCGCYRLHGHTKSATYQSWLAMWTRCTNRKQKDWKSYGGRGIEIHPEWGSFQNFLRDMGIRPVGKTLDRINNNYGYEINNCRWATTDQKARNKRRNYAV